jgi:hypothetical protein
MNKRLEDKINKYREELSLYLKSNNTTLVEYAKILGEDYISPILYPENNEELNLAIKSFDMYKIINESKKYIYYDQEQNYIYAIYQMVIEELRGNRNFENFEKALYIIFSDTKQRGKLLTDTAVFNASKQARIDVLTLAKECCENDDEMYFLLYNVSKIVEESMEEAISKVLDENPEMYIYIIHNRDNKGMQAYINMNYDVYNYITSENLNVSYYEKKLI